VPPFVAGLWAPYTHRDCTCNELVALRNRVVGAVPEPTVEGLRMLRAEARRVASRLPTVAPMSDQAFLDHYSGRAKSKYANAIKDLQAKPLDLRADSTISAFVKAEKFSPSGKVNPDPRMIQARNARYNVEVGKYLKPIEHHLYRLRSKKGLPLLGKGLSMQGRGKVLRAIWETYKRPVCVSLDGSRWDQHIAREVLEIEHSIYLKCNSEEWFQQLLKQQLNNRCRTSRGWRYKTRGKRMSGDMNTALGNCILMVCMVQAAMREIAIPYDTFDDGDDVLVIFESEFLERVMGAIPNLFLGFGQEVKVENISHRFEDIEWCQGHPVIGPDGQYSMVANWRKILSQSAAGVRYWHEPKTRFDMGFSVGQCLLAMYPGMPIIQAYATRLCSSGQLNRDVFEVDWIHKVRAAGKAELLGKLQPQEVTAETRTSFAAAFGVDEVEQIVIENALQTWSIGVGVEDVPVEVSGDWEWNYIPGTDPASWESPKPNNAK